MHLHRAAQPRWRARLISLFTQCLLFDIVNSSPRGSGKVVKNGNFWSPGVVGCFAFWSRTLTAQQNSRIHIYTTSIGTCP